MLVEGAAASKNLEAKLRADALNSDVSRILDASAKPPSKRSWKEIPYADRGAVGLSSVEDEGLRQAEGKLPFARLDEPVPCK